MSPAQRTLAIALGAFLLIGAGLSVAYGLPGALADARSLAARAQIDAWRDGTPPKNGVEQRWIRVRDQLLAAIAIAPENPQFHSDLGYLHALRASQVPAVSEYAAMAELRQSLFAVAVEHYRNAAVLRPMFPYGWAHLALVKHYTNEADAELWSAYDKTYAYGRNEPSMQRILAEIAFARWSDLGNERRVALFGMVRDNPPKLNKPLLELAAYYKIALQPVAATP